MRTPCLILLLACLALPAIADEHTDRRGVAVTGSATVHAMPDRARLQLGVEARELELDDARMQVNRVVREFLDFTRTLGIEDRHVDATGLQVRPEYEWDGDSRQRRFVGYHVSRGISIELTALERLGELLEGAVTRGINQVSPPRLDSGDRRALQREALARATEDARENAAAIAETLGVRLGDIRHLDAREQSHGPARDTMMMRAVAEDASGDDAATYRAGELRFEAEVRAEFDLHAD